MKFIVKQIVRGCGTLPHVGSHPGTDMLFLFIIIGALAGFSAGLRGMLGGAGFTLAFVLPIYLYGAYDRAQLSDELEDGSQKGE